MDEITLEHQGLWLNLDSCPTPEGTWLTTGFITDPTLNAFLIKPGEVFFWGGGVQSSYSSSHLEEKVWNPLGVVCHLGGASLLKLSL